MMSSSNSNPGNSQQNLALKVIQHMRFEHLVAGISGGVVSTLILHPLDLMKIRFAANDGRLSSHPQYKSLTSAFTTVLKEEGVKGLYRGVLPNVWGAGAAWGFYFFFYNAIKTWFQGGDTQKIIGPTLHMVAAAQSGILTLVMTNPVWVIKTRLCLQYSTGDKVAEGRQYKGMIDAFVKVFEHEGIQGLYKGFVPGMFGVTHGALQFMAYEEMKTVYHQYKGTTIDSKLGTVEYLSFAALSKLFAASVTYPYQVVRVRLQDHHRESTRMVYVIRDTWRFEGLKGFYKGIIPNLMRVIPATAITFLVYENMQRFLTNKL